MLRRIRLKPFLALNGAVDFLRWNGSLFYDSVSYKRRNRTVEEIENPVMDALQARAEFVDSIPQQVPPAAAVHAPVRAGFPPVEGASPSPLPKFIEPLQERA